MASGNRQPPQGCAPNAGPGKRDWRTPIPHLSLPGRKVRRGLNVFRRGMQRRNSQPLVKTCFRPVHQQLPETVSAWHLGHGEYPTAQGIDSVNGQQGIPACGEDLARFGFFREFIGFGHIDAFSTIHAAPGRAPGFTPVPASSQERLRSSGRPGIEQDFGKKACPLAVSDTNCH